MWELLRKHYRPGSVKSLMAQQFKPKDKKDVRNSVKGVSRTMDQMLINNELKEEEDISNFLHCWIHYESTSFYLWETTYMVAFAFNIFFTAVAICCQYLLLLVIEGGLWYFA